MKLRTRIRHALQPRLMMPIINRMMQWEQDVIDMPGAIRGGPDSPHRFNIMLEALKIKGDHAPMPGFPRTVPYVASSAWNIRKSVKELALNPANGRKQITPELLDDLRIFARSVNVDDIGFATVPRQWVFQETAIRYDRAIVLVMEMDRARMNTAPSPDTAVMVHETYDALGQSANAIAGWLRERGYAAHAGHPLGGMALYPPLAQQAGLGWRGISGLLITPQFGPRVRLAAVFTEIENLPVYEGDDHAWVADYCDRCRRCIHECPPGAIYDTPISHANGLVTTIDNRKCFPYFIQYHGCSICIKVCPFHTTSYEKLKARLHATDQVHVPAPA